MVADFERVSMAMSEPDADLDALTNKMSRLQVCKAKSCQNSPVNKRPLSPPKAALGPVVHQHHSIHLLQLLQRLCVCVFWGGGVHTLLACARGTALQTLHVH
jgi:hypothetical protein